MDWMRVLGGRPAGVVAIALVVLVDAVLSLVAAYDTIASDPVDWTAAALSVFVGTLMLIKVHGLWSYRRFTWLIVQALAALGAAVVAVELVRGHREPGSLISLTWHVWTLAYLNLPKIRALYLHQPHPSAT